jgi:hypothetical protein
MTGTIRRILTTGLRVLGFCRSHPSANVRYNAAMDVLEELPYACSFPPTAATPNGGYQRSASSTQARGPSSQCRR